MIEGIPSLKKIKIHIFAIINVPMEMVITSPLSKLMLKEVKTPLPAERLAVNSGMKW